MIHCSAGIGRSGTFIIVDTALTLIAQSQAQSKEGGGDGEDAGGGGGGCVRRVVDINGLALELRRYRMGLVQTREQLEFTWRTVVAALTEPRWAALLSPAGEDATPNTPPVFEREVGNQLISGANSRSVDCFDIDVPSSPIISGTASAPVSARC